MWRNFTKRATLRTPKLSLNPFTISRPYSFLAVSHDSIISEKLKFRPFEFRSCEVGFGVNGCSSVKEEIGERPISGSLSSQANFNGLCPKGYASVAEAEMISANDVDNAISFEDEVQELVEVMIKEEKRVNWHEWWRRRKQESVAGLLPHKYYSLKKRQVKLETEAWQQAVNEYRELLSEMCKHKLAPNLPYVKSLFLGWFEPLRDSIMEEQELIKQGKRRTAYAPYFDQMPADAMAVITMHTLMGLLMTGSEHGTAKVINTACAIGEAIEQEVRIHKFLEKTKKKKDDQDNNTENCCTDAVIQERQNQRKNVDKLMKKNKRRQVLKIVTSQDASKRWGPDARAKVGSRLIELLVKTAYIQPPANQLADDPIDLRPAFVHTFRTFKPQNK